MPPGLCGPTTWKHGRAVFPQREQFAGFVRALARFETVELLAVNEASHDAAARLGPLANCHHRPIPTNDSWIRDHGPIFLNGPGDRRVLLDWQYNAWGQKYPPYDLDNHVPRQIAELTGRQRITLPMVMEGGSVEGNGAGIIMTTDRCLLNPNRNPTLSQAQIEEYLREYLCADHVVWLTGEIPGDDTDSHIDQIGRFIDAQTVLLVDLPGSEMFDENCRRLRSWSRQTGISLEILRVQTPARGKSTACGYQQVMPISISPTKPYCYPYFVTPPTNWPPTC